MLRQKAASYALASMVELAGQNGEERGRDLCATVIAERRGLPVSYAAKILRQLAGASLLRSDRGPHGGYVLARRPEEISLLEILQAVGAVRDQSASLECQVHPTVQSNLNDALAGAMRELERALSKVTLEDLLEGNGELAGSSVSERLRLSENPDRPIADKQAKGKPSRQVHDAVPAGGGRFALG